MKDVNIKISVDSKGAKEKVKSLNKEVGKTSKATGKAGGALSQGFAGLGSAIGSTIPMFARLRAAIASTGIGAIIIAVTGLISLFTSVAGKAKEFSKSLSNLKAITGASKSEMKELSDQAQKLGSTTAFTASEVVELQTALSKLGFKTDDIKNSTGAVLNLAAALDVGLGEAAEVAGSLVKSFGLKTTDTAKVVDVMTSAASNSALSFDSIRESMKLVAPVSRAIGVSVERTGALLGVLADNGIKGSMAGTGLAKTFVELNKAGLTLEEGMQMVNDSSDPLATAIEMVGDRGGRALLTLAGNAEGIDKLEKSLNNATGTAERTAELQLDNVSGDMTKLGSAWEGLMLSIDNGNGVLSRAIRGFVQLGTTILGFLTPSKRVQDSLEDERTALYSVYTQLNDTNTSQEDRARLIKELQDKYPDYFKNIDKEKSSNEDVKGAIDDVNKSLMNKIILQNADEKLQKKIKKAAKDKMAQLDAEKNLRDAIAENAEKHNLTIIEGTLEEQAAAQKQQIAEAGLTMSLNDKDVASKKLRNGLTDLTKATKDYNESQEDMKTMSEANIKLQEDLGIVTNNNTEDGEDDNDDKQDEINVIRDLIAEKEEELRIAKLMPQSTEAEIIAKNKKIKKIEGEIKAYKELGVEKEKAEEPPKPVKDNDPTKEKTESDIEEFNALTDDEKKQLEKDKLTDHYNDLIAMAIKYGLDTSEITSSYLQKQLDIDKKYQDKADKQTKKVNQAKLDEAQAVEDGKLAIQNAALNAAGVGFQILGDLAEDNKDLQAAALIGENAVGIASNIVNTMAANSLVKKQLGVAAAPFVTANYIEMGAGIASSIAATAKGLKEIGRSGATGDSGSAEQAQAQAPSFNLVEGTAESQIASQIGRGSDTPIKAYVVSSEVTTAQQLDRNLIDNSGF